MEEKYTVEEVIERLKEQFPTVKILAGSIGFMVRKGHNCFVLPYTTLNDPNLPQIMVFIVTTLELGGGQHIHIDPFFENDFEL